METDIDGISMLVEVDRAYPETLPQPLRSPLLYAESRFFDIPIPVKISGCSPWRRSRMLWFADSEDPKLTNSK